MYDKNIKKNNIKAARKLNMTIIYSGGIVPDKGKVVALGNFDGVHRGHVKLITTAVDLAKNAGLLSCVYTFSTVGSKKVTEITLNDEKAIVISGLSVDILYFEDFLKVNSLSPSEFCKQILIDKLSAKAVVCGEDFKFGKNREGDINVLNSEMQKYGGNALIIPPVIQDGRKIGSTEIRALVSEGKIEEANILLGRAYFIDFPVIYGRQLGTKIGIPTINQSFPKEKLVPKNGVYACLCHVEGKRYMGVANIGTKPTVTEGEKNPPILCETHIIDFSGDLYGKKIRVDIYKRLRDEKKFSTLDELVAAVSENIEQTKKYFAEEVKICL